MKRHLPPINLDEYRHGDPSRWKCNAVNRRRRKATLKALQAADFKCLQCGADDGLTIHHAYAGDSVRLKVLCGDCHGAIHREERAQ